MNVSSLEDKRIGKALTALWLKGASPTQIDQIIAISKNSAELEDRARRWRLAPPEYRRRNKVAA